MNNPGLIQAGGTSADGFRVVSRPALLAMWLWPTDQRSVCDFRRAAISSMRCTAGQAQIWMRTGSIASLGLKARRNLASVAHSIVGNPRPHRNDTNPCGNGLVRDSGLAVAREISVLVVVTAATKLEQIPPLFLARLTVGAHAQGSGLSLRRGLFALGDAGQGLGIQGLRLRRAAANDR